MLPTAHREHLEPSAHDAEPLAQTQMSVAHQRGAHVQRTGKPCGAKRRAAPGRGQHFDFEVALKHQLAGRTDFVQEVERLGVAAHQHVLSVIDKIAGVGILEGIGATAERGFALEHRHAKAVFGKRDAGAKSGEPGADHDDIFGFDHLPGDSSRAALPDANSPTHVRPGRACAGPRG